ncbi:hypothetical protein ASD12_15630 [Mesorhizobium sp. Root102]|uniref:alginate lyase family protein n=1 Tax=Mesorhizobium sp. Root102 TaxID=1736422 RepID=UPI0006F4FE96|nr:alginate lyase family protein [Mesorhizobium sp. Root102]KQU79266.1 hypothetical protein ASD12_15630 [Mesorhizobium sp. Root102]
MSSRRGKAKLSPWPKIYRELKRVRAQLQSPWSTLSSALISAKQNAEYRRGLGNRIEAARETYTASPISQTADTFMLVRIIGNDLEPRHRKGQSYDNVLFILDNEPAFEGCEKFWIVNRIVDTDEEARIIGLLESRRQNFHTIPFELDAYRKISWDIDRLAAGDLRFSEKGRASGAQSARYETHIRRSKNLYVMNNNGARNAALAIARDRAKWLMPWDGNCYLTGSAFQRIRSAIEKNPHLPYAVVPMARIVDNALLLDQDFQPPAEEEPQIIFRADTTQLFDENYGYGRRPKIEMLWRLGVPGSWDRYRDDVWDFQRPSRAAEAGLFQKAGWVARLDSGRSHLEIGKAGSVARLVSRDQAIVDMVDQCDARAVAARLDTSHLAFYDEDALGAAHAVKDAPILRHLEAAAGQALARGPFSVLDKTGLAPSGDPQDYFHPAPYWWPDPDRPDGLPYVQRDGERMPGTALYEAGSETYDRTRLQRVFDDTTVLALAATVLGGHHYAAHAAGLIRAWFVDSRTRMNPHLRYAQVRSGHDSNEGSGHGIIELKDFYFFLDAVRLIERTGVLGDEEREAFRAWLGSYREWLDTAPAAATAFYSSSNQGTFYDLQRASIATFLGDSATLAKVSLYARERFAAQVAADGSLPRELLRTRPRHYAMFTLQGWTSLARVLSSVGDNLWQHRTAEGLGLVQALRWLVAHENKPHTMSAETIDPDRLGPLLLDLADHDPTGIPPADLERSTKPIFHPDEAIAPFWPWRRR